MNDLAKSFFISVLNANVSLHVAELGTTLGLLVTSTPTAAEALTTAKTHCGCRCFRPERCQTPALLFLMCSNQICSSVFFFVFASFNLALFFDVGPSGVSLSC